MVITNRVLGSNFDRRTLLRRAAVASAMPFAG